MSLHQNPHGHPQVRWLARPQFSACGYSESMQSKMEEEVQGPRPSVGRGGATRHKLPESSPREVTWATLNSVSFELCLTSSIRRARWRPRTQGFPWGLVTWVAFSGTYPALGLGEAKGYSARATCVHSWGTARGPLPGSGGDGTSLKSGIPGACQGLTL